MFQLLCLEINTHISCDICVLFLKNETKNEELDGLELSTWGFGGGGVSF